MSNREVHPLRTTETISLISNADIKLTAQFLLQTAQHLMDFDSNHTSANFNATAMVRGLAEVLEKTQDMFIKNDPDPLDDRHPHRTHPDSAFGQVLKLIFKNDDFMTKLVVSYILGRDNVELSIQSCRFLLACVPGLDSKVVFSDPEDFIPKLYQWANDSSNVTLEAYAMGLLAAALENPENASKYRNDNAQLVTHALERLRVLRDRQDLENVETEAAGMAVTEDTDFSALQNASGSNIPNIEVFNENNRQEVREQSSSSQPPPPKKRRTEPCLTKLLRAETAPRVPSYQNLQNLDDSNSKWDILQPFLIGNQQVYPLSLPTYQRFILQFLAACGEYQDLLLQTFEGNALKLLLEYIDLDKTKDIRVTFDATKYLTSLLVHRKFALEFMEHDGIRALLKLPRNSLASVGVVTAFYYVAYNTDVMEILCQMDSEVVDDVVRYVLWCLEHSYESGRASACMFFSQALFYKALLRRFDEYDGPRILYNYLATLTLIQNHDEPIEMTEEQVHTSTQCVRSVCTTFRSYLSAHIFTRIESLKKTYGSSLPTGLRFPDLIQGDLADYKSMKLYEEVSWECETILLETIRLTGGSFNEAENMRKLGMVYQFLAVRVKSRDWAATTTSLRNETSVHAMDCLSMMLCLPSIQLELLNSERYNHQDQEGIRILLKTAAGKSDEDGAMRMSALGCIQRCVYMEPECLKALEYSLKVNDVATSTSARKYSKKLAASIMGHLEKMWTEIRKVDGVMILLGLINCKTPITEADSIRKLATKVMSGLARHPEVRQLLSKLPLIAQSGLQILMREPVCADKRDIHADFCKEAMRLLHVVTGRKIPDAQKDIQNFDGYSEKIHRQWVIDNTKVSYNETELLQLIHDHLQKKGLNSVAAMLKTEAKLPDRPASRSSVTPLKGRALPSTGSNFTKLENRYPTLAPRTLESEIGGISARRPSNPVTMGSPVTSRSLSQDDDVFATPTLPPRRNTGNFPKRLTISPARGKQRPSSAGERENANRPFWDLDTIITDHFRTQHSTCKNPVTTCPPFSLFFPHTCPERTMKQRTVRNMALRVLNYDIMQRHQRVTAQWANERSIFTKFRNWKTYHDYEESCTKAVFSVDDEHLIVGMFNGEVHWINVETGNEEAHTNCHNSGVTHVEPSKDGSMLLTSSAYVRPLSALWRLGERMERLHLYRTDQIVRFANTTMMRIVGTNDDVATVYDTETNIVVDTYRPPANSLGYHYKRNTASFSPDDHLIFSDGMLWDVRNRNNYIHRFDRLNTETLYGTFHPHGTHLIIDQQVYDIRTLRVLHNVPQLEKCQVSFNSTGNIMYVSQFRDLLHEQTSYSEGVFSSFRTFDTSDYTALTTFEGKRPVLDLCGSHQDQKLCIIEQLRPQMADYMVQTATQLRLIEIGRLKDAEDENEEEEDEGRQDHEPEVVSSASESEDSDEDADNDGDDDDDEDDEDEDDLLDRERGSVFEALGRLGRGHRDSNSGDSDVESNISDVDFEGLLNQMIRQARQRRDQEENGDVPDVPDEEGEDPDFDMEAAVDDLVDRVDEEVDEDVESDDSDDDTWRTISRAGSQDINLDDLDADEAAAVENDGHVNEPQEEQPMEVENPQPPAPAPARVRNTTRRFRRNGSQPDLLNARVEEQRAQFMEAIGREQQEREEDNDTSRDSYPDEDEEINSVSTVALNPALRRKNRRHQD